MTLRGLIEAVAAGRDDSEKWRPALGDHAFDGMTAFHGSLDAAKRLHDALLPGWRVGQIGQAHAAPEDTPDSWRVWIVAPDYLESTVQSEAECTSPARAWLLAILRALEGEP